VTIAVLDPQSTKSRTGDLDDPSAFKIAWFGGTAGAGGQHRNKHETACRITHLPTGILKTAQTRSRKSSQQLAMAELRKEVQRLRGQQAATCVNDQRRGQIGTAIKADKRRTYRFQDGIVSDHLTGRRARIADVIKGGQFWLLWS
jgi:protein subunit release factor A